MKVCFAGRGWEDLCLLMMMAVGRNTVERLFVQGGEVQLLGGLLHNDEEFILISTTLRLSIYP